MSAGQIAAKEASKAAQKEKELAAFAKKQAQRDKVWQQGAKDTSKQEEATAKSEEKVRTRSSSRSDERGNRRGPRPRRTSSSRPRAARRPAEVRRARRRRRRRTRRPAAGKVMKKCKECKQMYNINSKKGCENCTALLFGGAAPGGKKGKKK